MAFAVRRVWPGRNSRRIGRPHRRSRKSGCADMWLGRLHVGCKSGEPALVWPIKRHEKQQMKEDIDRLFEKDDSEYNYEGEMAVTQLKTISRHAEALQAKMKPDTNLPEWVQAKITKAVDYLDTARDYMQSKDSEAVTEGVAKQAFVILDPSLIDQISPMHLCGNRRHVASKARRSSHCAELTNRLYGL